MIRIITAPGCDLPDAVLEQHRVEIVPLTVRFGETAFLDRLDMSIDEFWEKIKEKGAGEVDNDDTAILEGILTQGKNSPMGLYLKKT